jgi:transcriptional regulator with XRE-family HTH domain
MTTLNDFKGRLNDQQAKAAIMLVANELAGKDKKSQEELADEIGISRQQLYTWRTQNRDFIAYQAAVSDMHLESFRAEADAALLKLIKSGSVKGLDLYYTMLGKKIAKSQVEYTGDRSNVPRLTEAEVERGLSELASLLDD